MCRVEWVGNANKRDKLVDHRSTELSTVGKPDVGMRKDEQVDFKEKRRCWKRLTVGLFDGGCTAMVSPGNVLSGLAPRQRGSETVNRKESISVKNVRRYFNKSDKVEPGKNKVETLTKTIWIETKWPPRKTAAPRWSWGASHPAYSSPGPAGGRPIRSTISCVVSRQRFCWKRNSNSGWWEAIVIDISS